MRRLYNPNAFGAPADGGGSAPPDGFESSTIYDTADDLPAATDSGDFALVDDGTGGLQSVPRVYIDEDPWRPAMTVHGVNTRAQAETILAHVPAGDYISLSPLGQAVYVAEDSGTKYLLPAHPYGPGGGVVTSATKLAEWAASGDNTNFGDFSKDVDSGTTSVADDGSLVTLSVTGSGRMYFGGPAPGSSDVDVCVVVEDLEITAWPSGSQFNTGRTAFGVGSEAYVNATDAHRIILQASPDADGLTGIASGDNDSWYADIYDGSDNFIYRTTARPIPDGGTAQTVALTVTGDTSREAAAHIDEHVAVASLDTTGAGVWRDGRARSAAAFGNVAFLDIGDTGATGSVAVTVRFSRVSVWRLTVAG